MFPTPPTQTGGFKPEPIEGDSLTQYIRALANYLQSQGQGTYNAGQDVFGQGVNATKDAQKTIQPAQDFFTALLSGDPKAMTRAVAPTASAISGQYDAASRAASTSLPRGGFSAGLQASLPFQKAGQIGNLFAPLQSQAAQGLQGIAGLQGQLGQGLSQLGLGESGLGFNLFNLGANTQLTRRGQNVGEHNAAVGLGGSLANTLLGTLGGIAAKNFGKG